MQIGTWITMIRTPGILTLLQAAGLDFARVDMEHGAFSMETVADMAALARALDFPLVVRPPEGSREWITRLLDAGVPNLHVPQVDTPEQAVRRGPGRSLRPARRAGHVRLRPPHRVPVDADHRAHGVDQRAGARDGHAGVAPGLRAARRDRRRPGHRRAHARAVGPRAGPGRPRHARPGAGDRRASPPARGGRPAPREGRGDADRQRGRRAPDDRPRGDPGELRVGRRGAPRRRTRPSSPPSGAPTERRRP